MTDQLTQQQLDALNDANDLLYYAKINRGLSPREANAMANRIGHYILNSTPVPEGWLMVPTDLVSILREAVKLHQEKRVVLTVHMNDVARLLDRLDAPKPEDSDAQP